MHVTKRRVSKCRCRPNQAGRAHCNSAPKKRRPSLQSPTQWLRQIGGGAGTLSSGFKALGQNHCRHTQRMLGWRPAGPKKRARRVYWSLAEIVPLLRALLDRFDCSLPAGLLLPTKAKGIYQSLFEKSYCACVIYKIQV